VGRAFRRTVSRRQVHEVMTEFWQDHLDVSVHSDGAFTHRFSFDQVVREHALGTFADLLHATTTHPAMGIYLNNAVSTRTHPNENLGRELLELHTVGRGGYSEEDVKGYARILTGWRVDMWRTWDAWYSLADHWTGPVRVLGFTDANVPRSETEGRALTRRGAALSQVARVVRGDVGVEVIAVDQGDWDMHTDVGNLEWGRMLTGASRLAGSIAAFFDDLGD